MLSMTAFRIMHVNRIVMITTGFAGSVFHAGMRSGVPVVPHTSECHVKHDGYGSEFYQQELHSMRLFKMYRPALGPFIADCRRYII